VAARVPELLLAVAERELEGAAAEPRPQLVAARRERAEAGALGAAERFIARMVKPNLRSALGVWL
jgi:hypothetical protein